jgi:hypothetical protein
MELILSEEKRQEYLSIKRLMQREYLRHWRDKHRQRRYSPKISRRIPDEFSVQEKA